MGLCVFVMVGACEKKAALPTFTIEFKAIADENQPVPGVTIGVGATDGAKTPNQVTTDARGMAALRMVGPEGSVGRFQVQCPEAYRTQEPEVIVPMRTVRSLASDDKVQSARVTVVCLPVRRTAVVIVRAGGHGGLPVLVDGREMARTDADGVAHVLLSLAPTTQFTVRLDTSSAPDLRPQNPVQAFAVPDADDIMVMDQAFETEEASRASSTNASRRRSRSSRPRRVPAPSSGPVRLD